MFNYFNLLQKQLQNISYNHSTKCKELNLLKKLLKIIQQILMECYQKINKELENINGQIDLLEPLSESIIYQIQIIRDFLHSLQQNIELDVIENFDLDQKTYVNYQNSQLQQFQKTIQDLSVKYENMVNQYEQLVCAEGYSNEFHDSYRKSYIFSKNNNKILDELEKKCKQWAMMKFDNQLEFDKAKLEMDNIFNSLISQDAKKMFERLQTNEQFIQALIHNKSITLQNIISLACGKLQQSSVQFEQKNLNYEHNYFQTIQQSHFHILQRLQMQSEMPTLNINQLRSQKKLYKNLYKEFEEKKPLQRFEKYLEYLMIYFMQYNPNLIFFQKKSKQSKYGFKYISQQIVIMKIQLYHKQEIIESNLNFLQLKNFIEEFIYQIVEMESVTITNTAIKIDQFLFDNFLMIGGLLCECYQLIMSSEGLLIKIFLFFTRFYIQYDNNSQYNKKFLIENFCIKKYEFWKKQELWVQIHKYFIKIFHQNFFEQQQFNHDQLYYDSLSKMNELILSQMIELRLEMQIRTLFNLCLQYKFEPFLFNSLVQQCCKRDYHETVFSKSGLVNIKMKKFIYKVILSQKPTLKISKRLNLYNKMLQINKLKINFNKIDQQQKYINEQKSYNCNCIIIKDVNRSFHCQDQTFHQILVELLHQYVIYEGSSCMKQNSYLQGFHSIMGTILMLYNQDKLQTFKAFIQFVKYNTFAKINQIENEKQFYVLKRLIQIYIPELDDYFQQLQIYDDIKAIIFSWFLTIFTHGFNYAIIPQSIIDIFDIFLIEGESGIYGIVIIIFDFVKYKLINLETCYILEYLSKLSKGDDLHQLLESIGDIKGKYYQRYLIYECVVDKIKVEYQFVQYYLQKYQQEISDQK